MMAEAERIAVLEVPVLDDQGPPRAIGFFKGMYRPINTDQLTMNTNVPESLKQLRRLVGKWTTEATHPLMPGVVVHGTADVEWLEGERFLLLRTRTDHPDFPDALSVMGYMDQDRVEKKDQAADKATAPSIPPMQMPYFDSRGVYRLNETRVIDTAWEWSREAPGFSQRFTGRFEDEGNTIVGQSQLREDDVHWKDDLAITYRRVKAS